MLRTITPGTEAYERHFAALESRAAGRSGSSLLALRRDAMDRFRELGFPTTKHEEWKYTNVAPITRATFQPDGAGWVRSPETLPLWNATRCRLVFVNGRFAPYLSTNDVLPREVTAVNLASALAGEDARVVGHLARYASFQEHAFVALNTALMEDGAFIVIPRGRVVKEPIHLLFLATGTGTPAVSHPRNLIVVEEHSQATLIESYVGLQEGRYFTNAVTEIVVEENAVLEHCKGQIESESAFHVATVWIQQARSSSVTTHSISLGAALARNDIRAVLDGPGIETTLNGLYVARGRQHVDHHTAIDHAKPHCSSHELYKGILDDHATGVFNGKIFVRLDAQKTDAKQTNQNLLLSEDAAINTKPQLEIFADDVRCTHGATVGQLDENAIFYLRTRGIGLEEARALLTRAFASDVLGRIGVAPLREALEGLLLRRMPRSQAKGIQR